jgi:aspartate-semialdehyde dehydrogenase
VGLFSAGGSISEKYAPIAAQAGCIVIDNTAHFRRDKDIPLVVPEVNPHAIALYTQRNIIAIGKSRSSKIERIVSPTAPVAPTTQTLNFLLIIYLLVLTKIAF